MDVKKQIKNHRAVLENFSYITILQLFVLVSPLVLYPYLVRVLGTEIYGWVILAQVVVAYCSTFVDFGFNNVSARIVAQNKGDRGKMGGIISSILLVKSMMWIICFIIYCGVVWIMPSYKQHWLLFIIAYGLTFKDLLFMQFYFQGIEKMKFITVVSMTARLLSLALIILLVKHKSDYIYVLAYISAGYLVSGVYSLYLVFYKDKIPFVRPRWEIMRYCVKDAFLMLTTNLITTIKDKLNYILLANCVAVSQIVVYDLGSKFTTLLSKPSEILCTVLLPRFAINKNVRLIRKILFWLTLFVLVCVVVLNLFLPYAIKFFLNSDSIDLLPIRLYSVAPIFLSVSLYIAFNVLVAFGQTKYMVYSIIVTTLVYLLLLAIFYFMGRLNTVTVFVFIAIMSYLCEMIYRLWVSRRFLSPNRVKSK